MLFKPTTTEYALFVARPLRIEMGGSSAEAAYCGFVDAMRERVMGERMMRPHYQDDALAARRLSNGATETVIATVAELFGLSHPGSV